MQSPGNRVRTWPAWIPIFCVVLFIMLHVVAAWQYPGGTKFDHASIGYSIVDNFWCDLLDVKTYAGVPNPSRIIAIWATIVLSTGVSVLWWLVPVLYPQAVKRALVVRLLGLGSGLLTPLIATRYHDQIINIAAAMGIVALAMTMSAVSFHGKSFLRSISWFALTVAVVNYLVWQTKVGAEHLPLLQKLAFAGILAWVALVAGQARIALARRRVR